MFDLIAFDADDTLWHNETLYAMTQARFRHLLAPYATGELTDRVLHDTEMRNLGHFGYGIKGFTLSMIETAIELTEGRIAAAHIREIIAYAREMLGSPTELLDGVRPVIAQLATRYPLMIITKGDLFDQESKVARSGLGDHFQQIEVVSDKHLAAYQRILMRHGIAPERFLMVGNSLRSDILPVIALGGYAIHIPYALTWVHEHAEPPQSPRYRQIDTITRLTEAVDSLAPCLLNNPG